MGDDSREHDVLTALGQLATDLGPMLRPRTDEAFLQAIVELSRLVFDAAACSIALLDRHEEQLEFRVASGEGAAAVIGMRISASRGIAGWAVMAGQPIEIADVTQDPRFAADVAASTGYIPTAIMAMPLESEQQVYGVIEVLDRRRGGGAGTDDMELLALFARLTTLAVETSRIFSGLGKALFEAASIAAPDGDLHIALERQAREAPRAQADLAELSLLLHDLGELGADERRTAVRIVDDFLAYARRRRR